MLQKRATVYQLKGVNVHFSGKSQSENITNLAMIKNLEPNPYVAYMSTGWMKFISSNLKTQYHLVCFSCLESIEKKTQISRGWLRASAWRLLWGWEEGLVFGTVFSSLSDNETPLILIFRQLLNNRHSECLLWCLSSKISPWEHTIYPPISPLSILNQLGSTPKVGIVIS